MDTADNARLHYLDALRGVLMVLGVVLHSARPYDSNPWQVKDVVRLEWLDVVVSAIHLFRMPAFFMVAGYFAMFLLARQAMLPFLRERMRRVLVPRAEARQFIEEVDALREQVDRVAARVALLEARGPQP